MSKPLDQEQFKNMFRSEFGVEWEGDENKLTEVCEQYWEGLLHEREAFYKIVDLFHPIPKVEKTLEPDAFQLLAILDDTKRKRRLIEAACMQSMAQRTHIPVVYADPYEPNKAIADGIIVRAINSHEFFLFK